MTKVVDADAAQPGPLQSRGPCLLHGRDVTALGARREHIGRAGARDGLQDGDGGRRQEHVAASRR